MAAAKKPEPEVHVHDMSKLRGSLKAIGGSMSDDWNNILANQTVQTLWVKNSDPEEIRRQRHATVDVLIGMAPRDEFERMMAAQLIACHNASMGPDRQTPIEIRRTAATTLTESKFPSAARRLRGLARDPKAEGRGQADVLQF
jgi:hypothetical protein